MPADARSEFLRWQDPWLGPWALGDADAGPRGVPEPEHRYRTALQRDRDRIVHCSAFRRLDYKTQVFVPHEQDHYRTRLTHTLEVAQIGRTLARALRANEDAVEAVALAHDLGHAPFGHAGEGVLNELMAEHGGFEHNRQSLRVVDYLEHPYPDFRGLNLTRAVRLCLAKHETSYDAPRLPEFADVAFAPLEGQLVDLADEIAYTSADLADALAAGWINRGQLEELDLWRLAWQRAEAEMPAAGDFHKRIRACRNVLAALADSAIEETQRRLAQIQPASAADVQRAGRRCVAFADDLAPWVRRMQQFLLKRVYLHPLARDLEVHTRKIITALFEAYVATPSLLPARYQTRISQDGKHRTVCDYIAGMTDRYCLQQHDEVMHRKA